MAIPLAPAESGIGVTELGLWSLSTPLLLMNIFGIWSFIIMGIRLTQLIKINPGSTPSVMPDLIRHPVFL